MIAVCSKPSASSAVRIAATWPSIIALGATMSAPARAWLTAVSASRASAASLSTEPSGAERAAVPVVGVLAQAGVGDRHERQLEGADAPERLLHDPVRRPTPPSRSGPLPPAGRTGARRRHRAPASRRGLHGRHVGRQPRAARHRRDRLPHAPSPGMDEQRSHEHRRMERASPGPAPGAPAFAAAGADRTGDVRLLSGSRLDAGRFVEIRPSRALLGLPAERVGGRRRERIRQSGVGETARTRNPAARATSAVSGPMQTAGNESDVDRSACPSDGRPRAVEPLVKTAAAIAPSEAAARSRRREFSGASSVRYAITSSTSAPRVAEGRPPVHRRRDHPGGRARGRPDRPATRPRARRPSARLGWKSTSMPSRSRTRRVLDAMAAQFGAPECGPDAFRRRRIARAPLALVTTTQRTCARSGAADRGHPRGGSISTLMVGTFTATSPALCSAETRSSACSTGRVTNTRGGGRPCRRPGWSSRTLVRRP